MSETARRTLRGRKIGTWCICDGGKASPAGRAHIWVVSSCKGAERDKWWGPKCRADALAVVLLWRKDDRAAKPVGPSRRAHFLGVWSKTPHLSPCHLAIGCFQGNQYVILSSTVLLRTIAFQQTVLPPSRALTMCTIARKSSKMTDFSKTGSRNIWRKHAQSFFDPGFLFDFYSDRGSTAAPSARSNVSWCGLGIFSGRIGEVQFSSFFPTLIAHGTKTWRARVLIFGTLIECRTLYSN